MYAAASNRQKSRQVAPAPAAEPPAKVRRPEFGEGWYAVTADGRRPGDPQEALGYYTAPTKSVYQAVKPVRADDVPARRHTPVESGDETVRQRWLVARSATNTRWWWNLATFTAASGVFFAVLQAETLWANRNVPNFATESLKWCVLLLTMLAVAAVFEYGTWVIKLRRAQGDFVPEGERYFRSLLRCGIYGEVATYMGILCIIPVPSCSYPISVWDFVRREYVNYSSDAVSTGLMILVRLAFLVKCVVINDPLYEPQNALYARSCDVQLSSRFILRLRLRESLSYLAGFWIVTTLALAYCLTLAERPHDGGQDLNDADSFLGLFHNSLWLTIRTLTTVGYGDMYPRTVLGGFLAACACLVSIMTVACTVNLVMVRVALDDCSKHVVALTALARNNTAVRRQAVRCIERLYLLSPVYRKLHPDALPRLKFGGQAAVKELKAAHDSCEKMCTGPLADAALLHELCALRVLRAKRASLQRQLKDSDTQLHEALSSAREMELSMEMIVDSMEHSLQRLAALERKAPRPATAKPTLSLA